MESHISYETLLQYRDLIKKNAHFTHAISEHYSLSEKFYKKQPLFFKTILQEPRFNITLAVCCLIFSQKSTSISDIKALCLQYNIASSNSVIAVITLLRVSQRIKTFRCSHDRRKTVIKPTQKGLDEIKNYMSSAFSPFRILYSDYDISANLLDSKEHRHNFFNRVSEYLFAGMTLNKILPNVEIFINKDGGRMIMLYIYLQAIMNKKNDFFSIEYSASKFANKFFVSRVHVNRIINEASKYGYFELSENKRLNVSNSFIELVENYAGTYFSYVGHYLGILPNENTLQC